MKFLVFTDLHENKKGLKELLKRASEKDIDFVVSCGDISTFGRGFEQVLSSFNALQKKFYVVPGNHEDNDDFFETMVSKYPFCVSLHKRAAKVGSYWFLGYGGGGFSLEDKHFRSIAREWYGELNGEKVVLVTHQPPYGFKVDWISDRHVGNKDYRAFIERIKPRLVLCGHLHETVGTIEKFGEMKVVNAGWEGMVIELK